jgi:hypothetical protein
LGAALMYLLDPAQGRRRRALVRDQARRLARLTGEGVGTLSRDVSHRLSSLKARASSVGDASASDADVPSLQGGRTLPLWMQRHWSPATRALAGAGALAGVTLAVVTISRQSRSRTAHSVEATDTWDPAGFA